jgi:UDP-glucose 4-epimerase
MILIVGGLGFLGANLAKVLADQGEKVLITQHRSSVIPSFLKDLVGEKVRIIPLDVLSLEGIRSVIQEHKVSSIFSLASIHEAKGSPYQAFHVNVQGHVNLMEAMRLEGLKRITFASSIGVYRGMSGAELVREIDPIPIDSVTTYITATKRAAEAISYLYSDIYKIETIMARIGNVYGPFYESGRNPILMMVRNAVQGNSARLPLSEKARFDYIYVKDCARALALLHLKYPLKHRVYNIGGGRAVSLAEIADAITKAVPGTRMDFESKDLPTDSKEFAMENRRITEELGYVPEYPIERGIASFIEWIKEGKY